jgi:hypothetical protein
MFWTIYFWLSLGLTLFILVIVYPTYPDVNFADWLWIIVGLPHFAGLYSYTFKRRLASPFFWRWYFFTVLGIDILTAFYYFTPLQERFPLPPWLDSHLLSSDINLLVALLVQLPFLYAFYKLGATSHR